MNNIIIERLNNLINNIKNLDFEIVSDNIENNIINIEEELDDIQYNIDINKTHIDNLIIDRINNYNENKKFINKYLPILFYLHFCYFNE